MKAQTPAMGIMQEGNWSDAKAYAIDCECTDPTHIHKLWVERDPETKLIEVRLYIETSDKGFWKSLWQLMSKGRVELEAELVLSEQVALNYSETLKNAVKELNNK